MQLQAEQHQVNTSTNIDSLRSLSSIKNLLVFVATDYSVLASDMFSGKQHRGVTFVLALLPSLNLVAVYPNATQKHFIHRHTDAQKYAISSRTALVSPLRPLCVHCRCKRKRQWAQMRHRGGRVTVLTLNARRRPCQVCRPASPPLVAWLPPQSVLLWVSATVACVSTKIYIFTVEGTARQTSACRGVDNSDLRLDMPVRLYHGHCAAGHGNIFLVWPKRRGCTAATNLVVVSCALRVAQVGQEPDEVRYFSCMSSTSHTSGIGPRPRSSDSRRRRTNFGSKRSRFKHGRARLVLLQRATLYSR